MINSDQSQKNQDSFIGRMADNLVKKAKIRATPVLLSEILKVTGLKIKIISEDLGEGADGFSIGTSVIGYNNQSPVARQRFTFAHELGHILLGHNTDGAKGSIDLKTKDPKEKEANKFAAYLLIPNILLSKEKMEEESVGSLSAKYRVSTDAMRFRISDSKYLYKIKSLD